MLAIRMQRTGRRGHAQFRLIVQDSRFSPKSGRVVEYLGSYDPHTKAAAFDKQKTAEYLKNGAQPSDRAARLLKKEGVKLPGWVNIAKPAKRTTRYPEKLRRNRPAEEPIETAQQPETSAEEQPADEAPVAEQTEATEVPTEPGEPEASQPDEAPAELSEDKS